MLESITLIEENVVRSCSASWAKLFVMLCVPSFFIVAENGALASGFALEEQSVVLGGMATAGVVSDDADASATFSNPAVASFLDQKKQLVLGGYYVGLNIDFTDHGSYSPRFPSAISPEAYAAGRSRTSAFLPSFAILTPISERYGIMGGVTVNVPFGLSTEYGNDWVGRYYATDSSIRSLAVNPFLSIRLNHRFSFGFGIDLLYFDASLSSQVNLSAAAAQSLAQSLGVSPAALCMTLVPSTMASLVQMVCNRHGHVDSILSANTFAVGWNAGAVYQWSDQLRFGLSYRSGYSLGLDGYVDLKNFDSGFGIFQRLSPLAGASSLHDRPASLSIDLPATWDFSAFYKKDDRWDFSLDLRYINWSVVKSLIVKDSVEVIQTLPLDWRNSWAAALGAQYHYSDNLTLRGGLLFDRGASSPDEAYLSARLPDSTRFGVAAGLTYGLSSESSVSVSGMYVFGDEAKINKSENPAALGALRGSFSTSALVLGAQYRYNFS